MIRKNIRGDIPSLMYVIVAIAITGILIFLMSHLTVKIYDGFNNYFDKSEKYNNTVGHQTLQEILYLLRR